MQSHHYLGAMPKIGETLWYVAHVDGTWLALAVFSAPAAADGGSLAFSNVSVSPHVARGFQVMGADELARLLLCDSGLRNLAFTFDEASS